MLKKILSRDNLYPPIELYKEIKNYDLYKKWKEFINKDIDNKIWLYIHIPFCLTKCTFCHCKSFSWSDSNIKNYINSLKDEISIFSQILWKRKISNIYFWWWTPSILNEKELENFLHFLFNKFNFIDNVPFCFEAMPETLNRKKIDILKNYWVTRLSLWIQTLDDSVLKNINRFQNKEQLKDIITYIKKNIKYINLDLVCWLEWETLDSFKKWLDFISNLDPDIIHIYRFNPSDTTLFTQFWKKYTQKNIESREKMYNYAVKRNIESWRKKLKNDDYWFNLQARNISIVERIEDASSNIWIWYSARWNIFWELSYINSWFLNNKFANINKYIAYNYNVNEEKRRYVLQNIIEWLDFKKYKKIFNSDILNDFSKNIYLITKKYWKDSLILYNWWIRINLEKIPNYLFNAIFYSNDILTKIKNEIW